MTRYSGQCLTEQQRTRHWADPRIDSLPLADTLEYLRTRSWKEVPTDRDHYLVFQEPTREGKREPFCVFPRPPKGTTATARTCST